MISPLASRLGLIFLNKEVHAYGFLRAACHIGNRNGAGRGSVRFQVE
ncbi:hypothetical protein J2T21_000827 [Paeniglutamicibacter psychrophenolicus]|nr:hypothetical protein [Paeniglutamicibacter psychrophenolicus]